ncbi:MAG: GNAT family N-acetyltransferase [Methanobacteriota archaeon]
MTLSPVTLRGRHVTLEPLRAEHAPELFGPGDDPDVWQYTIYEVRGPDDVARWVRDRCADGAAGKALPFLQRDASTGAAFGSTSLFDIDLRHSTMEIGHTWLDRVHRGTLVNTEAKLLLFAHAFETLGANRVQLKTDRENLRSQRAIEKLGATKEGVLRSLFVDEQGRSRDRVFYSVLSSEWPAVKARLLATLES